MNDRETANLYTQEENRAAAIFITAKLKAKILGFINPLNIEHTQGYNAHAAFLKIVDKNNQEQIIAVDIHPRTFKNKKWETYKSAYFPIASRTKAHATILIQADSIHPTELLWAKASEVKGTHEYKPLYDDYPVHYCNI